MTTNNDHVFLVAGNGTWGQGATLDEAKRGFTNHGGRLRDGYTIMDFGPLIDWTSISPFGDVTWTTRDGSPYDPNNPDHQPVVTQRAPRR